MYESTLFSSRSLNHKIIVNFWPFQLEMINFSFENDQSLNVWNDLKY